MAANQFARGVDDRLPAGGLVGHLPTLDLGAAAPVGGGCRPGTRRTPQGSARQLVRTPVGLVSRRWVTVRINQNDRSVCTTG
jgi:hypothetical protein